MAGGLYGPPPPETKTWPPTLSCGPLSLWYGLSRFGVVLELGIRTRSPPCRPSSCGYIAEYQGSFCMKLRAWLHQAPVGLAARLVSATPPPPPLHAPCCRQTFLPHWCASLAPTPPPPVRLVGAKLPRANNLPTRLVSAKPPPCTSLVPHPLRAKNLPTRLVIAKTSPVRLVSATPPPPWALRVPTPPARMHGLVCAPPRTSTRLDRCGGYRRYTL